MTSPIKTAKSSAPRLVILAVLGAVLAIAATTLVGPWVRHATGPGPGEPWALHGPAWDLYVRVAVGAGLVPAGTVAWIVLRSKTWLAARVMYSRVVVAGAALLAGTLSTGLANVALVMDAYGVLIVPHPDEDDDGGEEPAQLTWLATAMAAVFCYAMLSGAVHLVRAQIVGLKSPLYLALVSFPATVAFSTALFAGLPLTVGELAGLSPLVNTAFLAGAAVLAVFGLSQSLLDSPWEDVHVTVTSPACYVEADSPGDRDPVLTRYAARGHGKHGGGQRRRAASSAARPLRIVQITDPHIGPFVSIARMQKFCQDAVDLDPDLVLMTGDYCTTEAHNAPGCLAEAFAPLAQLPGRVFATLGNHDHEPGAFSLVNPELASLGVTLLVNAEQVVDTRAGRVQLVGVDFFFTDKPRMYSKVIQRFPPAPTADFRILLIHDPGAFRYVPADDCALVLSGHTHGGQIGMLSCGLQRCTAVSIATGGRVPDHGVWHLGSNKLYVNRGQGSRFLGGNFLVRLGVRPESSILSIHSVAKPDGDADGDRLVSDSVLSRHDDEDVQ